eukprot:11864074-Heterocapsa_arctica.AAC.1
MLFLRARRAGTVKAQGDSSAPMEVDAIGKGKGKGKARAKERRARARARTTAATTPKTPTARESATSVARRAT